MGNINAVVVEEVVLPQLPIAQFNMDSMLYSIVPVQYLEVNNNYPDQGDHLQLSTIT